MASRAVPLCLCALFGAFACVTDDNEQAESDTSVEDEGEELDYDACGLPSPCAELVVWDDEGEEEPSIDVANAQCILSALAAGEPARLKFTKKAGAWEEWASTVWILEPGVAVHRYWVAGDLEPGTTTTLGREIDVASVSACMGSEDARELTDCLFDGWLGGSVVVDGCPE